MIEKIINDYPHIEFYHDEELESTIDGSFFWDDHSIEITTGPHTTYDELLTTINHESRHLYQATQSARRRFHSGDYLSHPDEIDAYGNVDLTECVNQHGWSKSFHMHTLKTYVNQFGLESNITKKLIKKAFINTYGYTRNT